MKPFSRDRSSLFGTSLYLLIGPLAWAAHMTVVYGSHTLLCTIGAQQPALWGVSPSAVVIAAATIAALGIVAGFVLARRPAARLLRVPRDPPPLRRFIDGSMLWLGFLSGAGIAWAGATVLLLDSCAQMR